MPLSFREALEACLGTIPRGRVATCGAVAEALGDIRAARSVAAWLLDHPETPRAHRVVRADGRPVVPAAPTILEREGVPISGGRAAAESFAPVTQPEPLLKILRQEQRRLESLVSEEDEAEAPRTVGGVDVSYSVDQAFAVAAVLDATSLETVEVSTCECEVDFPYIPTYLAFREFPAIRAAVDALRERPDLLLVDGHGRLHPTLFGSACFAGVRLDLPTIGIAKHPLAGRPNPSAGTVHGATPIEIEGVVRGYAWVPPGAHRPFYVSVGHRISLPRALASAQRATRRKYPEALLVADRISKERKVKKNAERSASGSTATERTPAQRREGF